MDEIKDVQITVTYQGESLTSTVDYFLEHYITKGICGDFLTIALNKSELRKKMPKFRDLENIESDEEWEAMTESTECDCNLSDLLAHGLRYSSRVSTLNLSDLVGLLTLYSHLGKKLLIEDAQEELDKVFVSDKTGGLRQVWERDWYALPTQWETHEKNED